MSALSYRIKSFVMRSGERYCSLISKNTGLPLYYPNLFLTTQIRNRSLSVAAMESSLAAINVLTTFCELRNWHLQSRFLKKEFLLPHEIDAVRDYCQLNFAINFHEKGSPKVELLHENKSKLNKGRVRLIGTASTYNRLTTIANYLKWFSLTILSGNLNQHDHAEIEKMYRGFKSRRPPKKDRNQLEARSGLTKEQVEILLEVVQPQSKYNPFDSYEIQVRNQLIIHLLLYLGIRGGELLNIKVSDIDFSNNQIVIVRRADEKSDPRTSQPLVKTLDRRLPLKATLMKEIHEYVLKFRNRVHGSRKHAYLFVTHKSGLTEGQPLSTPGYNKVIRKIASSVPERVNLKGHGLRHTWNDRFSEMMDGLPSPPSFEEQEKSRSYLQGWKEGSGSSASYNKRFLKKKALEAGLELQEGMSRMPRNLK